MLFICSPTYQLYTSPQPSSLRVHCLTAKLHQYWLGCTVPLLQLYYWYWGSTTGDQLLPIVKVLVVDNGQGQDNRKSRTTNFETIPLIYIWKIREHIQVHFIYYLYFNFKRRNSGLHKLRLNHHFLGEENQYKLFSMSLAMQPGLTEVDKGLNCSCLCCPWIGTPLPAATITALSHYCIH